MNVLSPTGITIPGLVNNSSPATNDLLIIQNVSEGENGVTQNISVAQLSTIVASTIFNENLNFTNSSNTFSGSFYGTQTSIPANFHNIISRNNVTVNNNLSVSGTSTLTGNTTITSGNLTITSGTLTISSGNTSLQTVSCGNITSTGTIEGTTITANTEFIGDLTGDVTGDIYSPTGEIVLQNGTGNQEDSLFYGTSSYSTKSNLVEINGVPTGGTTGQFLTKASSANYALTWSTATGTSESEVKSIVSSSMDGLTNYFAKFDNANHITRSFGIYENVGSKDVVFQSEYSLVLSNGDINVQGGSITSSVGVLTNNLTVEETTSTANVDQITIYGNLYGNTTLELSASSNVTLSLNSGQTTNILVVNEAAHTISEWSASFDGGVSVSDKIYWSGSIVPTIQTGAMDLYTFRNINGKIFGSAIQNFE